MWNKWEAAVWSVEQQQLRQPGQQISLFSQSHSFYRQPALNVYVLLELSSRCAAVCRVICPHSVDGKVPCTEVVILSVLVSCDVLKSRSAGVGETPSRGVMEKMNSSFLQKKYFEAFRSIFESNCFHHELQVDTLVLCPHHLHLQSWKMMHLHHYSAIMPDSQSQQVGHCCSPLWSEMGQTCCISWPISHLRHFQKNRLL